MANVHTLKPRPKNKQEREDETELRCEDCNWTGYKAELLDAAYEPGNHAYCPDCGSDEIVKHNWSKSDA